MAKLYFRYAVMNAGKSTQLLQIAYDYEKNNGKRALVIKPSNDTKEGWYVISRLENGRHSPNVATVDKIVHALDRAERPKDK